MNGLVVGQSRLRHSEADALVLELQDSQNRYMKLKALQTQIADIAPKVKLLQQVRVSEAAWITIIADLGRILPGTVVLDSMSATANDKGIVLRMTGKAKDQKSVADFMEALRTKTTWNQHSGPPRPGTINAIQVGDLKAVSFDVTVSVDGLMGGDF
jgi:Tfp pilus assembly protein PilN